jgi:cytochrome c oxidase subunit 3
VSRSPLRKHPTQDTIVTTADHDRPAHLAHHFDTPAQQFESGKQGIWIFLATEILLFGGLFCAYAVYRANHPEVFVYASRYLDRPLGAINTAVLICSSFTMAWAVRCAQRSRQKGLIVNLVITLLCACVFLGIKAVEYEHKWKSGLFPGKHFDPALAERGHGEPADAKQGGGDAPQADHAATATAAAAGPSAPAAHDAGTGSDAAAGDAGANNSSLPHSSIPQAPEGPAGLARHAAAPKTHAEGKTPRENVRTFFGIYFAMTGLHGLHVIAGMSVIVWVLIRSARGQFNAEYFTPVDYAGLYWHLVDLIWIYLFPLLYLIH